VAGLLCFTEIVSIDWLWSQQERGIHPGLTRMKALLEVLGHPEHGLIVAQIAGTNGKGSTSRFLNAMIAPVSSVGLFTSPHLFRFHERMSVNNLEIPEADLERHIKTLQAVNDNIGVTFFELITAIALLHFHESRAKYAVLEVGLGGRLDSTSAVDSNVSVITNIDLDHTQILGDTLEKIAFEKAGIIRAGVPVVTGATGVALEVIEARAAELNAPVWVLNREIKLEVKDLGLAGLEISVSTPLGKVSGRSKMLGIHQASNAALAIAAAQMLEIPDMAIQQGLESATNPGRLEYLSGSPSVLLDAAHNPHGARALASFVTTHNLEPVTLIVGSQADKDFAEIARVLEPIANQVICTKASYSARAAPPETIAPHYQNARISSNVEDAIKLARETTPENGLILIAGTIPLIAEALEKLRNLESEGRIRWQ
jgi:dihydrofolate synthase / folylpolyglutamate synthase